MDRLTGEQDGILVLSINRPAARNAISKNFVHLLTDALAKHDKAPDIRVLILRSAAPGVFCAGADLKERAQMKDEEVGPFVSSLRDMVKKLFYFPLPTIAALDGLAVGGGLEMALACDIRVASKNAKLGLVETTLGIIPGKNVHFQHNTDDLIDWLIWPILMILYSSDLNDWLIDFLRVWLLDWLIGWLIDWLSVYQAHSISFFAGAGGTQLLPRLIGTSRAKNLIFSGNVIDAEYGKGLGIVNHTVDQNDKGDAAYHRSVDLANRMLGNGPIALRMAKMAINLGIEMDLKEGLEVEERCYGQLIGTKDRQEGLLAFQEKRKPKFIGA